ncbi:hypothetical protein AG4045_028783 [Apium graveolens]|uniref:Uncharacterized protein n=1 Tax=Apium graveolens TaxID=4045 RepID=A0A6L5BBH5_APIGR|nr:hypothetical protein AG4045_028783 [Apium graveolens]
MPTVMLYKDVRAAVDLCHRDGTLKEMVALDPKRYINEDKLIVPMLKMLRDSGRATFLVTNRYQVFVSVFWGSGGKLVIIMPSLFDIRAFLNIGMGFESGTGF